MYKISLGDVLWGSSGYIWVAGLYSTWQVCDTSWSLSWIWDMDHRSVLSIDWLFLTSRCLSSWCWGYSTFGVLNLWLILWGGYWWNAWRRTLEFILLNTGMSFGLWTFARGYLGRVMECICLGRGECFRDMQCYRGTHTTKRYGRSSACSPPDEQYFHAICGGVIDVRVL